MSLLVRREITMEMESCKEALSLVWAGDVQGPFGLYSSLYTYLSWGDWMHLSMIGDVPTLAWVGLVPGSIV